MKWRKLGVINIDDYPLRVLFLWAVLLSLLVIFQNGYIYFEKNNYGLYKDGDTIRVYDRNNVSLNDQIVLSDYDWIVKPKNMRAKGGENNLESIDQDRYWKISQMGDFYNGRSSYK